MLKTYTKYVFLVIFLILLYVCFLIIKPFIPAVLTSIIMAYIFYPLYKALYNKTKMKTASSFIVTALLILVVTIPVIFMFNALVKEAYNAYNVVNQVIEKGINISINCNTGTLCEFTKTLKEIITNPAAKFYFQETIRSIINYVSKSVSEFIFSTPRMAIDIFVMFFLMFYLFKDGDKIVKKIECFLPIKKRHRKVIVDKFDNVIYAVIYGYILMAVVQGLVAMLGYFIFRASNPILWGLATMIAALLPFIGSALVWMPLSIYMIFSGLLATNSGVVWRGAALLVYGFVAISSVDNILRPKFISVKADIHPIASLLGVLGGLFLFGFIGIFIGPLLLALLITFIEIYIRENLRSYN